MTLKPLSLSLLALVGVLAACDAPDVTELTSKTSTVDSRIKYTVQEYAEPHSVLGIKATHVLTANIVQLSSGDGHIYYGLPEAVVFEVLGAASETCKAQRKELNDIEQRSDAHTQKTWVYFKCS